MAKKGADKSKAKGKGKKPADGGSNWPTISVAAHPRASQSIRRAKAWAALLAFAVVAVIALQSGEDAFEALLRALAFGLVAYFIVWAIGVVLWRQLVVHEAKTEAERRRDERLAQMKRLMESSTRGDA